MCSGLPSGKVLLQFCESFCYKIAYFAVSDQFIIELTNQTESKIRDII